MFFMHFQKYTMEVVQPATCGKLEANVGVLIRVERFLTCSNAEKFLSQAEELHGKLRIFTAKFFRFGELVP
jgi:hypothetical protein